MIPRQYRTVAFTDVEIDLDEQSLRDFFLSRQVYRRTRFVVARRGAEIAVVELVKTAEEDLFVDVAQVRMLARPEETILVVRPDIDTAVPSLLARAAADAPDGIRCVVVRGRYEHINFILDGAPRRIHVLDVAPPWPAKLVDQVQRVVDTAEDLPATECVPQVVDLEDLAAAAPAGHYLLPCRGGWHVGAGRDDLLPRRGARRRGTGLCSAAPVPGPSTTTSIRTGRPPCARSIPVRSTWRRRCRCCPARRA